MKLIQETPEVYYLTGSQVLLEKKNFDQLIDLAFRSKSQRARYCTHQNKGSNLHEMFEVFTRQTYLRPLKQEKKIYSFHIIQGAVDIYLFSNAGEVTDVISLGDFQSGKTFYFRPPANTYRTLLTMTDFVLYHEVTTGPFQKEDTIFAHWAPQENDTDGIGQFILQLHANKISRERLMPLQRSSAVD